MEYDVENHLVKVITPNETLEFKYDSEGKRIKKTSTQETAIYISGSYEIRITDGQQKLIKHIFTGSDRTITVEKTQGQTHTYFCHNDHLGSTNVITDEYGNIVQQCEYTPYGEIASNTGTYNSPYKFTSKELDDSTQLYYYGARYYDPVLCHFIQADTIVPEPLNPQSFNRYSYCYNNPLIYTDPSGNFAFLAFLAIAAAVVSLVATIAAAITHSETWRRVALVSGIVSTVASIANFGVNLMNISSQSVGIDGGLLAASATGEKVVDLGTIVVSMNELPTLSFYTAYEISKPALAAGTIAAGNLAILHTQSLIRTANTVWQIYRQNEQLANSMIGMAGGITEAAGGAYICVHSGGTLAPLFGGGLIYKGMSDFATSLESFMQAVYDPNSVNKIPPSALKWMIKSLTTNLGPTSQDTAMELADTVELATGLAAGRAGAPSTTLGAILKMKKGFEAILKSGKKIMNALFQ